MTRNFAMVFAFEVNLMFHCFHVIPYYGYFILMVTLHSDGSGESLQKISDWRRALGNLGGIILSQGSKRSDQGGTYFTDNVSSRMGPNFGENSHSWRNYNRSGQQGSRGQGIWQHRLGGNGKERDHLRHDRDVLEKGYSFFCV